MKSLKSAISTKLHYKDFADSQSMKGYSDRAHREYKFDLIQFSALLLITTILLVALTFKGVAATQKFTLEVVVDLVVNYGYWPELLVTVFVFIMWIVLLLVSAQLALGTPLESLSEQEIKAINEASLNEVKPILIKSRGKLGLRTLVYAKRV